jgi:hypothetical protein
MVADEPPAPLAGVGPAVSPLANGLTVPAPPPSRAPDDPLAVQEPDPADDEARIKAAANIFNARPVS